MTRDATTLPDPCTGAEIARRLRVSAEWWAHNRKRLEADCGFPAPLPGFKRPLKWDPLRVEAWIRSAAAAPRMEPTAPMPAASAGEVPPNAGDAAAEDADTRARRERLARNSERLAGIAAAE